MRIASYAFWFVAPLSFGSLALTGAACSDSSETTPVATEAGSEAGTTSEGGAKDTGAQDPDTGPACKLSQPISNEEACNTCGQESCCPEVNACTEDQDCQAFIACATACLNDAGVALDGGGAVDAGSSAQTCATACQKSHKSGAVIYQSFSVCIQSTCKSECIP